MNNNPGSWLLISLLSVSTANAADVYVSAEWIQWFMNWGSVESAANLKGLDHTISIEMDSSKACFSVNLFHESHCYQNKISKGPNKVCWGGGREAEQCVQYLTESAILTLDGREILVKVRAKSIAEFMNQTMVAGKYKSGSGEVELKPDGTLIGIPGFSKYSLSLRANDRHWEGIQIGFHKHKRSDVYSIVKVISSLVLREKQCLDEDADPICMEPLNTNIKYVFKQPLPKGGD